MVFQVLDNLFFCIKFILQQAHALRQGGDGPVYSISARCSTKDTPDSSRRFLSFQQG
jgi:hypothetical protein